MKFAHVLDQRQQQNEGIFGFDIDSDNHTSRYLKMVAFRCFNLRISSVFSSPELRYVALTVMPEL